MPDAAPGDDFAGYSDADIDAILAADDQFPEPRTRQEAAADTWDGTPDDPAGSDDWPAQLAEALEAFTRLQWPRNLLRRPPSPANPGDPGGAR